MKFSVYISWGDDGTCLELFWVGEGCRRFALVSDSIEVHISKEQNYMQVFSNKIACKDFF